MTSCNRRLGQGHLRERSISKYLDKYKTCIRWPIRVTDKHPIGDGPVMNRKCGRRARQAVCGFRRNPLSTIAAPANAAAM